MNKNKHILLIDDDDSILNMLKAVFEEEGYLVDVAKDGKSGLDFFFEHHPDLVILDIIMPECDGYETLKALREKSEVPVIMLTGVQEPEEIYHSYNLGADGYIKKPFMISVLLAHVKSKIRRFEISK